MKKRLFCLILSALMLSSALISCSDSGTSNTDSSAEAASDSTAAAASDETAEETESDTDSRASISDNLGDRNYDGKTFRVLTTEYSATYGFDYTTEIAVEELTGETCNDAVYNRNLRIQDRFNAGIVCETSTSPSTYINTLVQAGTDEYDIVGMYDFLAYNPINSQTIMNWLEIPNVDLSQPWHNQLANNSSTFNGILYGICSDLSISSMLFTHAIFFNTRLASDIGYNATDIYDLVLSGDWTLDKLIEVTSNAYQDTNGNGIVEEDDILGFSYSQWNAADVWMSAFDQPVCQPSADGKPEVTLMTDKAVAIVEKLVEWHNSDYILNYDTIYEEETKLADGKLVFAPIRLSACFGALREMSDEYAIVPYPKWDKEQENYLTNADDKFTVFMVPKTASDLDFIGAMYEVLSAESYKTVYPAYYDTALKGKYSTDETMAHMIDLIMAGRNFDFSFQFGESYFQQLPYWCRQFIQDGTSDISSRYAKIQKSLSKGLKSKLYPLYGIEE